MAGEGGQSPGQGEGGSGQNPVQGAGGAKTVKIGNIEVPQDAFDEMIKDRIAEVKDAERGKYKDYADLKKAAAELAEIKKGQMTEVEKLKTDLAEKDKLLASKDQELTGLKLDKVKSAKLAAAGIDQEWIDSVGGSTEEEIDASIAKLAKRLKVPPPAAAQGAGNPGVQNNPQNSKTKIWKESEIRELRLSGKLTDELMAEIKQATAEGRVQ